MYKFTIYGECKGKGVVYKPIKDFPNYLAGSDGSIYSIKRKKFLVQEETKDGYLKVTLSNNNKTRTRKTHRYIAETFVENPFNKPQVNHIDGNKKNNNIENLEWVTAKENAKHAKDTGLFNQTSIAKSYNKRIEKYGIQYLLDNLKKGYTKEAREKSRRTLIQNYKDANFKEKYVKSLEKAKLKVIKKTCIKNIITNEIKEFPSRKAVATYLNIDPRRISDAIKYQKQINNYIVLGGEF